MKKKENKDLAELRKKELARKELENDIGRHLKLEEEKRARKENQSRYRNKYVDAAIIFFGTLAICYLFLFLVKRFFLHTFGVGLSMLGVQLGWIDPVLHGIIWTTAVYSVYRERSVLDDILHRFF